MKFLIASLAFCACVCLNMNPVNGYGSPVYGGSILSGPVLGAPVYGAPGLGGYAANLNPALVLNTAVPVYNIPVPGPVNVPAYGNIGNIGLGNIGLGSVPAKASSAAAASASVSGKNVNNYGVNPY